MTTRRLLGVSGIAQAFGISPTTVHGWLFQAKQGELPPLPTPDVEIPAISSTGSERLTLGWAPERLPEFYAWRESLPGRAWRKGRTGHIRGQRGNADLHPQRSEPIPCDNSSHGIS